MIFHSLELGLTMSIIQKVLISSEGYILGLWMGVTSHSLSLWATCTENKGHGKIIKKVQISQEECHDWNPAQILDLDFLAQHERLWDFF